MATATQTAPAAANAAAPAVTSTITWFEIPTTDFGRAVRFYEALFASPLLHHADWPNMAIFPYERPGISGAIVSGSRKPCADGTVIYLNCEGRIDKVLGRVEKAGGKIVEPKSSIPNVGWIAEIFDSEGNRIGLHDATGR
jgi:predicted enzyme related to lactoylglutathione lyase